MFISETNTCFYLTFKPPPGIHKGPGGGLSIYESMQFLFVPVYITWGRG